MAPSHWRCTKLCNGIFHRMLGEVSLAQLRPSSSLGLPRLWSQFYRLWLAKVQAGSVSRRSSRRTWVCSECAACRRCGGSAGPTHWWFPWRCVWVACCSLALKWHPSCRWLRGSDRLAAQLLPHTSRTSRATCARTPSKSTKRAHQA